MDIAISDLIDIVGDHFLFFAMTHDNLIEANNRIINHFLKGTIKEFEKEFDLKINSLDEVFDMAKNNIHIRNHPLYSLVLLKQFYNL